MRVLYSHRQEGTAIGGGWRALCGMATRVRALGVEPELLFTLDRQPGLETEGIPVHGLRLPSSRKGKSFALYPAAILRLARFLRERRPDVVHLNDLDDAIFFVAACRAARSIPVVGTARSLIDPRKFRKHLAHRLERLVCVSEAVRARAVAAGIPDDRIMVLHDPPDPRWRERPSEEDRVALRRRLGIREGAPVIGTVGNISPVKGTDVLAKALAAVASRFPEVRCVIVGADEHGLGEKVAAAAENAGTRGHLVFAGPLPDPRAAVSLMDVFVLPSREEGYGLALLEAMSCGKPVVATRVGGVPDIVPGEEFGVLVPKEDPVALAGAIAALLADPERRDRLGKAGAARVRESFGEGETEKLVRMYRELAAGRNG